MQPSAGLGYELHLSRQNLINLRVLTLCARIHDIYRLSLTRAADIAPFIRRMRGNGRPIDQALASTGLERDSVDPNRKQGIPAGADF